MAILVKFDVAGMESGKYDEVIRRLEAAGQGSPDGRLHHFSYGDKTNLQVVDVFESQAKMEAFGATLVPILQSLGIQAKPEIFSIYTAMHGNQ